MKLQELRLEFEIGDKTYVPPPVSYDAGEELTLYFEQGEEDLGANKERARHLFGLVLGATFEEMKADGVSYPLIFRTGMAALAAFQIQAFGGGNDEARHAAQGIMEAGLNPEALAAWAEAKAAELARASGTTSPGTRRAARGSSTKRPASTAGTKSPRASKPRANRSPGSGSSKPGS